LASCTPISIPGSLNGFTPTAYDPARAGRTPDLGDLFRYMEAVA
jgi:hypothetical protein